MPTNTKTSSKRNAAARSSLARGSGLSSDERKLIKIYREMMSDPDMDQPYVVSISREIEFADGRLMEIELHKRLEIE